MNQRERLVAAGVAVLVAVLLAWYGAYWYFGQIEAKERTRDSLASEVKKRQGEQRNAQSASKRLANYEERSLPREVGLAKSLYEKWLLQTASDIKPKLDVAITAQAPTPMKNTYS